MPESDDIVAYLFETYGEGAKVERCLPRFSQNACLSFLAPQPCSEHEVDSLVWGTYTPGSTLRRLHQVTPLPLPLDDYEIPLLASPPL